MLVYGAFYTFTSNSNDFLSIAKLIDYTDGKCVLEDVFNKNILVLGPSSLMKRAKDLTDEELDKLLPGVNQGYEIVKPPDSYKPA